MNFVSDEDYPLASTRLLRQHGHRVLAIVEEAPGASDVAVMEAARIAGAILLTMDRDYGELVFYRRLPPPSGIVYFRLPLAGPEDPALRLLEMLELEGMTLPGSLTVVSPEGYRQRPWLAQRPT
ncbi:MAG: DUF5615 family PIN-like protein [Dehalococcoidia bacterium]